MAAARYLMPGLADMHVHYNEPSFAVLFLANGVTTVRNMSGHPFHLEARAAIERDGLGRSLYTAGPIMDGSPPSWEGSVVIETAEQADQSVVEQKDAGYDILKVYSNLTLPAYDAIIAAARKHEMRVAGHVPGAVGIRHALASGLACLEHLYGYLPALVGDDAVAGMSHFDRLMYAIEHADESRIPELVDRTVEAGAWNCVTLIVHRLLARGRFAYDEERKRRELRYLSSAYETQWRDQLGPSGDPARTERMAARAEELRFKITRALRDACARLLLGTDTPNPLVVPGFSIHEELALLVQAGLSPYEALRAGTHDAAELLGAQDEFGTIAVGRRADLILLEANPLDGVANVARPAGVMSRGRWYPEEELRSMLAGVAARVAQGT